MIQLTKDLVVTADRYCYTIGTPRQRPGKGIVIDSPRYYTNMDQAVRGALDTAMRMAVEDGSITTLRQFIEEQERLHDEIRQLLAPLSIGNDRTDAVERGNSASEGSYIPEGQKEA